MPTECSDGAVRLVNGKNSLEGLLEVCFNNIWGTVCDNSFDSDDAQVICNQLSVPFEGECSCTHVNDCDRLMDVVKIHTYVGAVVLNSTASFGSGVGPVFVESLRCDGSETSILDCSEVNLRRQFCTHDRDVSVRCIG